MKFVEGRMTNPANTTKDNLQADLGDPKYAETSQIVSAAFLRSREFRDFTFAQAYRAAASVPLRAGHEVRRARRCGDDRAYGREYSLRHFLHRLPFPIRRPMKAASWSPISRARGPVAFKARAGDAIVYPSTLLHEVRPVRSGSAAGVDHFHRKPDSRMSMSARSFTS